MRRGCLNVGLKGGPEVLAGIERLETPTFYIRDNVKLGVFNLTLFHNISLAIKLSSRGSLEGIVCRRAANVSLRMADLVGDSHLRRVSNKIERVSPYDLDYLFFTSTPYLPRWPRTQDAPVLATAVYRPQNFPSFEAAANRFKASRVPPN